MVKRKSNEISKSSNSQEEINKPLPKKKKTFKIGDALNVSTNWVSRIRYSYWSLLRGGKNVGYLIDNGKFKIDFDKIPRNWKEQVKKQIHEKNLKDWEYRIFHKEKFWWNYNSWNVEITPKIRLNNISMTEMTDLDTESDESISE